MRVANFGGEVEFHLAASALLRPLQGAGSELRGDGNVDLPVVQPEVSGFHGDGQLHDRRFRAHGVFQLTLAIFGGVDAEVLGRVIALAIANARPGNSVHFHAQGAPAAVMLRIRAVVAQQIISGSIGLHGTEGLAEVSQIEKAAPAGIGGQRGQSLTRILARAALLEDGGAGKHGVAAGRSGAGIAAGNFREQAARVHGVNGHIGAIGGVGGGAKLGAIVFAGLGDAAGELQHRFLAGDIPQHSNTSRTIAQQEH